MGSTPSVEPATGFEDLSVGIVGTGMMARAHATAWTKLGMKVFIGSREPSKATALAAKMGNGCQGGCQDLTKMGNGCQDLTADY